jgi:hypothetical protein
VEYLKRGEAKASRTFMRDPEKRKTFGALDLDFQMRYSLIYRCGRMNFRKGFDRVFFVLAVGWFSSGGEPYIEIYDSSGRVRAVLGATSLENKTGTKLVRPESSLILFGKDGTALWMTPN